MKLIIDTTAKTVIREEGSDFKTVPLFSATAFQWLSKEWLKIGWSQKYSYSFTWFGLPILQLPEDLVRIQEVLFSLKPDVIVETGVARGGSLIFYASLCKLFGKGRVIGIDIDIRPHNRQAIEEHSLFQFLTLIEGSSIDPKVLEKVKTQIHPQEKVIVMLDSCHEKHHVLAELERYGPLVNPGSYIVVMDGVMEELAEAPQAKPDWSWNNPKTAALEFIKNNPNFIMEEPPFLFSESQINQRITYWPSAFVKKIGPQAQAIAA